MRKLSGVEDQFDYRMDIQMERKVTHLAVQSVRVDEVDKGSGTCRAVRELGTKVEDPREIG